MELAHKDIQARISQGYFVVSRIRRGLVDRRRILRNGRLPDGWIRLSGRWPDQTRHGVPGFDELVKIYFGAWCNNGQGVSSCCCRSSIEPTPWDIGQIKLYFCGKSEISCTNYKPCHHRALGYTS